MPVYSEIREDIRNGDLLAWQGLGLVGGAIRRWTGATYSHVGIAFRIHGRVVIAEAREGKGVCLSALSNRLPAYHIPTEIEWTEELSRFVMNSWDLSYSYLDAVRAGLGMPTAKGNGYQCAEYAGEILVAGGRLKQTGSANNTPGKLVDRVLATGGQLQRLRAS